MPTCSRQTLVKDHAFLVKPAYYLKSLYGVRGQEKLDKLNQKMKEDGITPKGTCYQTEKQFLRDAIEDSCTGFD